MTELFAQHERLIATTQTCRVTGRIIEASGLNLVAEGITLPVGSICTIARHAGRPIPAQIVTAGVDRVRLIPLEEPVGVGVGDPVTSTAGLQHVPVGRDMLGTILDGLGRPIGRQADFVDQQAGVAGRQAGFTGGRQDFTIEDHYPVFCDAPAALTREPITDVLATGIRSIDAMLTVGTGQRIGLFAGTGVGKSVLTGMIARYTGADVIVLALVGERGREVGDFLRKDLGEEGLARSVVVVSTSDESPVLRVRAPFVATAVAEYFRDLGKHVLLLMDSTTRMAMAQRQIGLAAGEPPTTKGYPPSVFGLLPKLLERSGRLKTGSITGLYTVLVEGDDISEPISDAVRSVLDGHVWLSRDLANRGHYPAVAVLESISRVMVDVVDQEHAKAAETIRRVLAVWNDIEDLVNLGAYAVGTNVEFDVAVKMKPAIDEFFQQRITDKADFEATHKAIIELANRIRAVRGELEARTPAGVEHGVASV